MCWLKVYTWIAAALLMGNKHSPVPVNHSLVACLRRVKYSLSGPPQSIPGSPMNRTCFEESWHWHYNRYNYIAYRHVSMVLTELCIGITAVQVHDLRMLYYYNTYIWFSTSIRLRVHIYTVIIFVLNCNWSCRVKAFLRHAVEGVFQHTITAD